MFSKFYNVTYAYWYRYLKKIFFVFLFFSIPFFVYSSKFQIPNLSEPVIDQANIISIDTKNILIRLLKQLKNDNKSQIQILTVPSLYGLTIEQASIEVVDKWQLGDKEKDNGLLLLISKNDQKIRIEVGQGLEGNIPDAIAKRIIDDYMVPFFKKGDFDSGILAGVYQIIKNAHPQINVDEYLSGLSINSKMIPQSKKKDNMLFLVLFFIFIFLFFNRIGFFRTLLISGVLGSGVGLRRNDHFGGGSWSGGGGGFSGGGASGGW